ncbi:molybdopterin molybdotransferase MoeA [Streptomyces sp. WMMB303]|uniref:molybdopterin molybdotransferase MoeA n=1 Tax=Streptomyces sp. WMMB303 TaxID=3034154 RepID=UPI0023EDC751|nr:molybdopterin molybdotransferase MoeA [Streptomyces sp. WMMB303]MDF4251784.1 molybdopterin-binding protein [Streptomyces sp. WMMB303]
MSDADELDEAIALANSGRIRQDPPPAPRLKRIRRIQWGADGTEGPDGGDAPGPAEHPGGARPAAGDTGRGAVPGGAHPPEGVAAGGGRSGHGGDGPAGHPGSGAADGTRQPTGTSTSTGTGTGTGTGTTEGTGQDPHGRGQSRQHPQDRSDDGARQPAVTWSEAVALASSAVTALPPETVPLAHALGRTLAAPLRALTDLPPFDTSAMDGWAVSGPGPWEPARAADGTERPGLLAGARAEPPQLADGEAVRIATGARVPPGASAVLRREAVRHAGARVRTATPPQPGTDIRPRGQECRKGDELLPAGAAVTPAVLGLAAAAGYDDLPTVPRPRAEVLVLGDELLHRGLPRDGRIRDALGPMVEPWLTALGAEVTVTRLLGDDAEALHEALAGSTADVLVTTGSTAAGPLDHLRPTLRRLDARLLVHGVRVRPGHPMLLAVLGPGDRQSTGGQPRHRFLVGLPGNPLAALSGLVTLAAPLLRALAGRGAPEAREATLGAEVSGHPHDTRLVPVRYEGSGLRARIRPLRYAGPAMLRGVASCDALAVVPPGGGAPGTDVPVLDLPW